MCRQSAMSCPVTPVPFGRGVGQRPVDRLMLLPDPRRSRGRRHPLAAVLLLAAAAVVAGARSYAAIGQWAHNAPQATLTRVNARLLPAFGVRVAPSGVRRLTVSAESDTADRRPQVSKAAALVGPRPCTEGQGPPSDTDLPHWCAISRVRVQASLNTSSALCRHYG